MKWTTAFLIDLLLACVVGCGAGDEPKTAQAPSSTIVALYDSVVARVDGFLDGGWIVSRYPGGEPEHLGDSLIRSGLAMAALPCDGPGATIEAELAGRIDAAGGGLQRHRELPDDVSLDGALGLYFGVASRVRRCPGSRELWRPVVEKHVALVVELGGRLNRAAAAELEVDFKYVLRRLGASLDIDTSAVGGAKDALEREAAAWAQTALAAHSACYRVHLGWLALRTLDELADPTSGQGRALFCAATDGADLPVVDRWCRRVSLKPWIESYEFDKWAYRHEDCPAWQTPDESGRHHPAIDLALAVREEYAVPEASVP